MHKLLRVLASSKNRFLIISLIILLFGSGLIGLSNYQSSRGPNASSNKLPGGESVVDPSIEEDITLEVYVKDKKQNPIPRALVEWQPLASDEDVFTGRDGKVSIDLDVLDILDNLYEEVVIYISAPGYKKQQKIVPLFVSGDSGTIPDMIGSQEIEFVLEEDPSSNLGFTVTVQDEKGQKVPNMDVNLYYAKDLGVMVTCRETDAQGVVRFDHLVSAQYTIEARFPMRGVNRCIENETTNEGQLGRSREYPDTQRVFNLTPERYPNGKPVTIALSKEVVSITGTVFSTSGNSFNDVSIELLDPLGIPVLAPVRPTPFRGGEFIIPNVKPGRYTMRVSKKGYFSELMGYYDLYEPKNIEIIAPSQNVKIELKPYYSQLKITAKTDNNSVINIPYRLTRRDGVFDQELEYTGDTASSLTIQSGTYIIDFVSYRIISEELDFAGEDDSENSYEPLEAFPNRTVSISYVVEKNNLLKQGEGKIKNMLSEVWEYMRKVIGRI